MKVLVVIDMQNDFIAGALGTVEAQAIVPKVTDKIRGFEGRILATRDTHEEGYLDTQEGEKLPGYTLYPEFTRLADPSGDRRAAHGAAG